MISPTYVLVDFDRPAVTCQFLVQPEVGGKPEFAAAATAVGSELQGAEYQRQGQNLRPRTLQKPHLVVEG